MIAEMEQAVETFEFTRDDTIEAPVEVVFQAVLDQLGPESSMPDGTPLKMKLEAWPGGRWFRDLGNNAGHFWGHVQVIKPPTLIELCGPMFMSYAATNHVQYRLTPQGKNTRLTLTHKSIGLIPKEQREGMTKGWTYISKKIGELAVAKQKSK